LKYSLKYNKNYISRADCDSLVKEPLILDFASKSDYAGHATHFRATVRPEIDKICAQLGYNLQTDGLKIYTTIDFSMQQEAERAVEKHMAYLQQKFNKEWGQKNPWKKGYLDKQIKNEWLYKQLHDKYNGNPNKINEALHKKEKIKVLALDAETGRFIEKSVEMSPYEKFAYYKKFLQVGFVACNPQNGEVKAWVGGLNPKYFAYDHVMQGQRQPGSTFKPILYSAAISNGYSPCEIILDVPVTARTEDGKIWSPHIKATNKEITFKTCLAKSLNNCAALLIRNVGPKRVVEHAVQLGIPKERLEANLSLALGTSSLKMMELLRPYMAFCNQGELIMPHYITKIEDQYGRTIWERTIEKKKDLKPMDAFKMVTMLREGILH
jgi:penicillin-binding protein 1A